MLVRVTRQGGSVLVCSASKTAAEMTKKPRLGGTLHEQNYAEGLANGCYTAIAQKPSTGCISQYPSVPPNTLLEYLWSINENKSISRI